jgi:hypothetical protein
MKSKWMAIALLLGVTIAGVVWQVQRNGARAQQEQAAALQAEREAQSKIAELRSRSEQTKPVAPLTNATVRHTTATVAPTNATANKAAMMNDPETRALMRKQKQQQISKAVDRFVSTNFIAKWNLTLEQAQRVKDLVGVKLSEGNDLMMAMLFDGLDDAALAKRGNEAKQVVENANAALRDVLGEDGFKALNEREQAMAEQDRVRRMREEFKTLGEPLTGDQEKALLAAMSAERQAFSFRVDFSDLTKVDYANLRDFFSEPNLQKFYEDMQQLNSRVEQRAAAILSAAQLKEFTTLQTDHLDRARLSVKMTTELFNKRRGN